MSDIQVFYNKKQQSVGRYKFEDKTYRKKVKHSLHLFRMRDAWGIDKKIVETIRELGCETIKVKDEESGRIYVISFSDFFKNSIVDVYASEGMQFFCSREHFDII